MKKFFKTLLIVIIATLVIIQFIRPDKITSNHPPAISMESVVEIPQSVLQTFKNSCYDCHSDNTRYPWYWNVQPGAWILSHHIKEGHRELNFSAFGSYTLARQYKKFGEIKREIEQGKMPMSSYLLLHNDARLTDAQKQEIFDWADQSRKTMESRYPIDSLQRKK